MELKQLATAATIAISAAFLGASAQAQTVEEFYGGNTLTLMVSASPGGGLTYTPALLRHSYPSTFQATRTWL